LNTLLDITIEKIKFIEGIKSDINYKEIIEEIKLLSERIPFFKE